MDQEAIQKHNQEQAAKQAEAQRKIEVDTQLQATIKGASHVAKTVKEEAAKSRGHTQKVEVTNTPTIQVQHTNDYKPLLAALQDVQKAIKQVAKEIVIPEHEAPESVSVNNLKDYSSQLADVIKAVKAIKVNPQVTVTAPNVELPETTIDTASIEQKLDAVVKAVKAIKAAEATDLTPLTEATKAVKRSIESLSFPVPNYVLPFTKDGKATQVTLNSDGSLPITASISTGSLATSAIQTDGTQKTQIVDAGGEAVTVTGGKLDVNASASLAGDAIPATGATTAVTVQVVDGSGNQVSSFGGGTQYTEDAAAAANPVGNMLISRRKDTLSTTEVSADGDNIALNATNKGQLHVKLADTVTVDGSGVTQPVSGTVAVSNATFPVTDNGGSLTVDGTVTAAAQPGVDIGDVTVNNAAGASAVNIQDGGNSITVDGTITANLAAGTNNIGDVDVLTINGVAPAFGTGVRSASTQRVTIATDDSVPVTGTFWQATQPVSLASVPSHAVTNAGTFAVQDSEKLADNAAFTDGTTKVMPTGYIYDEVAGTALTENDIAAARINANRSQIGIIEDGSTRGRYATVTASNALKVDASGVAVPITDNAGSLTVDNGGTFAVQATEADGANVTLGSKADAKSTATDTTAVTIMSVLKQISASVQAPPSQAVTNAGTFAVQATLAAETTKVIGVVRNADGSGNLLTSTSNALDVNIKTSAASNISTNTAQINGVTPLMGNGTSGTGAQRVTIASDSTGQVAPAANATSTGLSMSFQSALTNTKVAVNASAGNFYGYHIYNPDTVVNYVQIFNVASASVTLGTTTPNMVLAVPPLGWADAQMTVPVSFGTALTVAATTTATGSTAPAASLLANFFYK